MKIKLLIIGLCWIVSVSAQQKVSIEKQVQRVVSDYQKKLVYLFKNLEFNNFENCEYAYTTKLENFATTVAINGAVRFDSKQIENINRIISVEQQAYNYETATEKLNFKKLLHINVVNDTFILLFENDLELSYTVVDKKSNYPLLSISGERFKWSHNEEDSKERESTLPCYCIVMVFKALNKGGGESIFIKRYYVAKRTMQVIKSETIE